MATFTTALYNSQIGAAGQSANVGFSLERDSQGKKRTAIISYTALGTEATNDLVKLVQLPIGAKVLATSSQILTDATVGTAVTVRVGDQTTANRWAGTIDISAGGFFPFTNTLGAELTPVAVVGASTNPATADNVATLKFVAVTAITAGKVINVFLTYVLP